MLGLPRTGSPAGVFLLAVGLTVAFAVAFAFRRRLPAPRGVLGAAAALALIGTLGLAPFLAWRYVEDMRYTTSLDSNYRNGAGPIQAFLQPYLLDDVPSLIPPGDTFYAAVGDRVPYPTARKAFPSLAVGKLLPRRSVASPRRADWIVAWGIDPASLAPVGPVRVVRPRSGTLPPLVLAKVRR